MTTVLHTKLEYVNRVLRACGMGPVAQLDATRAAAQAEDALDEADANVQARGWHFNTERDVKIAPDGANNIIVPTDALSIDPEDPSEDLVQIGTKMFDRKNNSFVIPRTLRYKIVRYRNWTDLTTAAQDYIAAVAAREFQDQLVGSESQRQVLLLKERAAAAKLFDEESKNVPANAKARSFSVWRVLGHPRRNPLLEF